MRPKNRPEGETAPFPDDYLEIADIRIGRRHRKDHGDLQVLADSIALVGLLQPIGISEDRELVFGERRLLACRDILGWSEIPARTVDVRSIVEGEFHENEVRKDFTPSERVAIERAINAELERRRGSRSDLAQDLAPSEKDRVGKQSARLAGFGNRETYRQARKVVERGTPELVEAMDRGEIAIGAAADLASEPQEEQRKRLDLPTKKEALKQAKATGAAILARDGRYYGQAEPEREARIGEKIDLDLDTPEALERKADKRTEPKPERKGRKRREPVPSVAIEDPAQPSALPARDRLKEDLWKVFNAVGRADQLRFIYDACLHHGLDPLRMAPPAAFGLAEENPELTARLAVEVPPATDDATVSAQAEQRDDVADPGTEDPNEWRRKDAPPTARIRSAGHRTGE
jgi:hypothetical protein